MKQGNHKKNNLFASVLGFILFALLVGAANVYAGFPLWLCIVILDAVAIAMVMKRR